MMRTLLLCVALLSAAPLSVGIGALLSANTAAAQSTPRSVCCAQLRGRWENNLRSGEMRCYGVNSDGYYKCVAGRSR